MLGINYVYTSFPPGKTSTGGLHTVEAHTLMSSHSNGTPSMCLWHLFTIRIYTFNQQLPVLCTHIHSIYNNYSTIKCPSRQRHHRGCGCRVCQDVTSCVCLCTAHNLSLALAWWWQVVPTLCTLPWTQVSGKLWPDHGNIYCKSIFTSCIACQIRETQ